MTEVKKDKNTLIANPAAALALYAPPPAEMTGKMGVEVELGLYAVKDGAIRIPDVAAMAALQTTLRGQGYDAQLEAAGVLEYASGAVDISQAGTLLRSVMSGLKDFERAANQAGYTISPYSILPTTTREEALANMANRERLVTSIAAMQEIFPPATVEIPLLTAGVQTSFSPRNADEMFAMTRRAYLLTPLLIAFTNASAGFVKNGEDPVNENYRMRLYDGYGVAGGISPAFLKATDGESFIRAHIEAVFDAPMHFAYRPDGSLQPATVAAPLTFRDLIARGWNTQSNYELAESFLYNDIKICNLRDADGNVKGKRMEVRAADSGPQESILRAMLLTAEFVPAGPLADAFEAVCARYGFTGTPAEMADLLRFSREAAIAHGGAFMSVPYGTGHMTEFAREIAGLLRDNLVPQQDINFVMRGELILALESGTCPAEETMRGGMGGSLGLVRQLLKDRAAAMPVPVKKPPATPRF